MIELFLKNVADLNVSKKLTLTLVIVFFILFGFPSAWSFDYFNNQDWVWGVGLILTGLFILIGVAISNPAAFKEKLIDLGSDMKIPTWFFKYAVYLNIVVAIGLIYWWMSQDYSAKWWDKQGNWDVLGTYSNASTVTQWGAVILIGLLLNNYLFKKFVKR